MDWHGLGCSGSRVVAEKRIGRLDKPPETQTANDCASWHDASLRSQRLFNGILFSVWIIGNSRITVVPFPGDE